MRKGGHLLVNKIIFGGSENDFKEETFLIKCFRAKLIKRWIDFSPNKSYYRDDHFHEKKFHIKSEANTKFASQLIFFFFVCFKLNCF